MEKIKDLEHITCDVPYRALCLALLFEKKQEF